ncbi:MAG: lysophospholipid acyltransferase family protein [Gammaproteobacteria bacterium]|nr:lysophospholipid acyltransferase family protein [Gammaproteobacteria bacterium]
MTSATFAEAVRFAWRWIASMLAFVVFGLGGLALGMLVFPLVALTTASPAQRISRRRRLLQGVFRLYLRLLSVMGAASFSFTGDPRQGSYLIVANHPTLIDAVLLLTLFPQADCIVKQELLRNPFIRFALSGLDYMSNADTADMLEAAIARLRSGRSVLVFPEGTRSLPGQPVNFHLAAATLAVRSGARCLPVLICCEPVTTSKQARWYEIADEKPHFTVHVDPPLDPAPIVGARAPRYAKRVLNEFLQGYYNRRLAEIRPQPASAIREAGQYSPQA